MTVTMLDVLVLVYGPNHCHVTDTYTSSILSAIRRYDLRASVTYSWVNHIHISYMSTAHKTIRKLWVRSSSENKLHNPGSCGNIRRF